MNPIFVVKVQVPIASTDPTAPALIYAKGRKHIQQRQLSESVRKRMAGDVKAYFEAEWTGTEWIIADRVKDQDW